MLSKVSNVLVVGMGEVGRAIYGIAKEKYNVIALDVKPKDLDKDVDIMHICFPYTEKFIDCAIGYIKRYRPTLTIIESTILPGTTGRVYEETKKPLVHSPVRGTYAKLSWYMRRAVKYVGAFNREDALAALKYYTSLGLRVKVLNSPIETELGKLLDTTYYALCIAWHQEMKRMCDRFGADFDQAVTEFNKTYNELYRNYHPRVARPVLFPGYIAGHCLIANAKLLKSVYPSKFVELILESNENFEKEHMRPKEVESNKSRIPDKHVRA